MYRVAQQAPVFSSFKKNSIFLSPFPTEWALILTLAAQTLADAVPYH